MNFPESLISCLCAKGRQGRGGQGARFVNTSSEDDGGWESCTTGPGQAEPRLKLWRNRSISLWWDVSYCQGHWLKELLKRVGGIRAYYLSR